ncbi:hypothetical protein [Flammeovirga kamogawensis]|uniref:Uncharacterized protein n=1 Tax=Flammeovirga kamogawensis TaxID=373891 RepID=A0ABX8H430_9BACT|nr:hypothetical protein [Flammeovirga kamogawensis]MBB6461750.1 hypothetical protein [Flammeovirga kamogawensis]QWG10666.1 hypothetical protein KM029_25115 [Flammeovirga kamogawensis]
MKKLIILTLIVFVISVTVVVAGCSGMELCGHSFTYCSGAVDGSNEMMQEMNDLINIYC